MLQASLFQSRTYLRAFSAALLLASAGAQAAPKEVNATALLVDKKTHQLHVAKYVDGAYQIVKTYHATLGQLKGDKQDEGDLKTPEGIYTFDSLQSAPALKPMFGAMAFHISFPNTF